MLGSAFRPVTVGVVVVLTVAGTAMAQSTPAAPGVAVQSPAGPNQAQQPAAGAVAAQPNAGSPAAQQKPKPSDNYDELFERYLEQARVVPATVGTDPASMWVSTLSQDRRARRINDLITISVVENISGSGTADAALSKANSANLGLSKLVGLESKLPSVVDPTNLISGKSATDFKGTGTTNRAGQLTGFMTARVAEVLPNGDLVVEGAREIEINGDRQMVVLTGVIRTADISTNNVVLSTSIGQLRIRYFGRGLMKDNLKPGFLVRILNKIF